MSNSISGKEALIALANGEEVECFDTREVFKSLGWFDAKRVSVNMFFSDTIKFRLKLKTILINGVEVPAPFKPNVGDKVYSLNGFSSKGYESWIVRVKVDGKILWRTEDEIKQVVEALRKVFNQGEVV